LSEILIIDVEATCWRGAAPPGEQNEIIEIGACLLHPETGQRSERESILVRPQRSKVSAFCTELTTLTQAQVDEGVHFYEACELLRTRYRSAERTWASYGDYDRKQFQTQCASFGVEYPFSERHLNVKAAFARLEGLSKPVGMAGALKRLRHPLEGTHHRGGDDAWNIAAILEYLLRTHGLTVQELCRQVPTKG
jgi:inhibitor of KinA sporulation pathway (predicted exonuclease)